MHSFIRYVFLVPVFLYLPAAFAQEKNKVKQADSSGFSLVADSKIEELMKKRVEINKKTNGKKDGYRIQIHFGAERSEAKNIKSKFLSSHPSIPAYEVYQQPNFKIRVGDFKTKIDAHRSLKEVQKNFPGAFIVEDKIEMMKLD